MGGRSKFMRVCAAPNCGLQIIAARGLCGLHYQRFRLNGTLENFAVNVLPPGVVLTEKTCGKCKRNRAINCFGLNSTERNQARRNSICKECRAPTTKARAKFRLSGVAGRATDLLQNAKIRAASKGLICTLDEEWIRTKLAAGCEMTGLPFDLETGKSIGRFNPYGPSIDRKIAGSNYTPENCRMVIMAINVALNAWGEELYRKVAKAHFKQRREQRIKLGFDMADPTYDLLLEHTQPVHRRRH